MDHEIQFVLPLPHEVKGSKLLDPLKTDSIETHHSLDRILILVEKRYEKLDYENSGLLRLVTNELGWKYSQFPTVFESKPVVRYFLNSGESYGAKKQFLPKFEPTE